MSSKKEISQQWLKNIKKLDSKNQLDHGEIYAYDGSVFDFKITGNKVTGKVQGPVGEFHEAEIKFRKFTNDEKKTLRQGICENPLIYMELLNNEISDELLECGVKILPDSMDDFEINCTCLKHIFCKHAATLMHKLAIEISKDPFLIFSLKGFDLKHLYYESYKIKTTEEVLNNETIATLNNSGQINFLVKLNFILSDYPSFYKSSSVNFNEVICDTLASMAQCIYQIFESKQTDEFQEFIKIGNPLEKIDFSHKTYSEIQDYFEDKWDNPYFWNDIKININDNYDITKISTGEFYNNFIMFDLKQPLFAFLAEINQFNTAVYCDKLKFLHELYLFTAKLVNRTALIPEFFQLGNGQYHIRWIPSFEKVINDDLKYFYNNCPKDLLTCNNHKLSGKNQVNALISLIFEGFSRYYMKNAIPKELSSFRSETYFKLFFIKSLELKIPFEEFEIDNWISPLLLNQRDYKLILKASESKQGFDLQFKIRLNDHDYCFDDIVSLNRLDIIRNISIIRNIFAKSGFSFDFSGENELSLHKYSFFLDNIAPILEECGIEVINPLADLKVQKAQLLLTNPDNQKSTLTLKDLAEFDWKIAIGDETFTIDEFESDSCNYRGLVKIRDKFILLDRDNLNQLHEDISNIPDKDDASGLIRYLLSNISDNVVIDDKLEELVDNILDVKPVSIPSSLNADLRDYQKTGFSWLIQNMQLGFGSILADDMGLGKTIQLLTAILYLKEKGMLNDSKVLIVAPTSILTNWMMEIEKFAPCLKVKVYHGVNRYYPEDDFDILLTSYGIVRQDFEEFKDKSWFLLVVDEAQKIKNPKSLQTKSIKSIKAQHYIALSGTPIENNLGEYWSIFDFTNKGYLNDLKIFKKRFLNPIEREHDEFVLDDFKKITSPFILRRLKTDYEIVKELPDKIVNDVYCNLTVKQASMYDEALNQLISKVEKSEGIQRRGLVFKLINSLKQICNHPSQYLKTDRAKVNESGKMEVLMDIVENILKSDEKVLIFTQYIHMGEIMVKLFKEKFGEEALFLHGRVNRKKQALMIDEFQNGDCRIFILSLKAGGVGLNLTAASNVIHYDLWWNPAVENQATDRAYRIGQTENVMVYRLITTGTLEEKINQILFEKRELVDRAIGDDESFITELSNDELRKLLNLRDKNFN